MTAGYYAPLPPARTGVADYAATLLGALRERGTVNVNASRADVFLYHLGNNQLHGEIYRRALARPGVVVLHDAVLQHFFLGSLSEQKYVDEFAFNYGEWHRDLARELWRGRARSAGDHRYFAYPMLRRIAETSRAVIVHNPAAARMVREHAPAARVIEIPLLFAAPDVPSEAESVRLRAQWGISQRAFLFGVFGYLREPKRISTILRAFATIRAACPGATLLIAGHCESRHLERILPRSGHGFLRLPYLPGNAFWSAATAVDACINLRYPAAGESSGIATGMMGIGKAVLVTAGEETSAYPETSCVRIEPGLAEQDSLTENSVLLGMYPQLARAIGQRAAEHIRSEHSLDRVADEYWRVLRECAN